MIRRFALLAILLTLPTHSARASFWMECEYIVAGDIAPDKNGLYIISPISSKVTGGHSKKDEPCIRPVDDGEYPMKVKIEGEKPQGMKTIALYYHFFNGMTPDGVVNNESWVFIQPRSLLKRAIK